MAFLSPGQLHGLGGFDKFLDVASRPDVMDQALLYMAPWHWKQKKREEKKLWKREQETVRETRAYEQRGIYLTQKEREADYRRRREAMTLIRRVMEEINSLGHYVNEELGKAFRTAGQYNMGPRVRSEAKKIEQATITLSINLPSVNPQMGTEELEAVSVSLEQSLSVMGQLYGQAKNLRIMAEEIGRN
jgi:hypothetical protein